MQNPKNLSTCFLPKFSMAKFLSLAAFFFLVSLPFSTCLPFIVIHGLGDECSSEARTEFTENLSKWSNSKGYCIEIGNGIKDSWFMPLERQAEILCSKVKEMKELSEGFNIVGVSQGNLVGRAIVQYCDGVPPVRNFVSMGGIHAGSVVLPSCGGGSFCKNVDNIRQSGIFSSYVQNHLAPSNYIKSPVDVHGYLNGNKFLTTLNNEIPHERNVTYKERFSSLEKLVLIKFEQDAVLVPRETSWFGFFPDGAYEPVLPPQMTKLYIEDWIGLRKLDEAGKVTYVGVPGQHVQIAQDDMKKHIVPYLTDESQTQMHTRDIASSWTMSVWNAMSELIGEDNTVMQDK